MKESSNSIAAYSSVPRGRILLFYILTFLRIACSHQTDDTTVEYATGREITEAVIRKILRSNVFVDEDYGFLLRIAYVESMFGAYSMTFREGYFGGIWQVDQWKLETTKDLDNKTLSSILQPIHESIHSHFKIDWMKVEWSDLLKPLYSGLAARFFIAINSKFHGIKIPDNINRQAYFWDKFYKFGKEYEQEGKFRQESRILQNTRRTCRTKLDLVIGIDGSSSVGRDNFPIFAKHVGSFLEQTFDQDTLKQTQIGVFIYSTLIYRLFGLENDLSLGQMREIVESARFPYGDTRTDIAMRYGTQMLINGTIRSTTRVPQVLLLFQEGQSGISVKEAASMVAENNIRSIVIGIGKDVNVAELMEMGLGDRNSVFNVSGFASLSDFFIRLSPIICTIPQKPIYLESLYNDTLVYQERRHFILNIPMVDGVTIFVYVELGSVHAYWSYTDPVPSEAVHDGQIDGITYIPAINLITSGRFNSKKTNHEANAIVLNKTLVKEDKAYVTIQGIEAINIYQVYTAEGDQDDDNDVTNTCPTINDKMGVIFILGICIRKLFNI